MTTPFEDGANYIRQASAALRRQRIFGEELRRISLRFVTIRWWLAFAVGLVALIALILNAPIQGMILLVGAVLLVAANALFHRQRERFETIAADQLHRLRPFAYQQLLLDGLVMVIVIAATGGINSPLLAAPLPHIVIAALLLPRRTAVIVSLVPFIGISGVIVATRSGLISQLQLPAQDILFFIGLVAAVLGAVFVLASIVASIRRRIRALRELIEPTLTMTEKLGSLYAITQAASAGGDLAAMLDEVAQKVRTLLGVRATSIKLLSEDESTLTYAAAAGLPESVLNGGTIALDKSPLNRRVLEGEPFVSGNVAERELFQFGEHLVAANFSSVLFVPLRAEKRVLGILGAYRHRTDRFDESDTKLFQLAADVLAIAIENAYSDQALAEATQRQRRFMRRVAHDLRAPLSAIVSMLDTVRGGYQGELNEKQAASLKRIDRRVWTMLDMIGELMNLEAIRNRARAEVREKVALSTLAGRLERTFNDRAREQQLELVVVASQDLPTIEGDPVSLEQMLENLVSNAIKYSKAGGTVDVAFERGVDGTVRIIVRDQGIGIPSEARPKLFTEFFRAKNARELDAVGTGLGLVHVKEVVATHDGEIEVESELGSGTTFTVTLPIGKEGP